MDRGQCPGASSCSFQQDFSPLEVSTIRYGMRFEAAGRVHCVSLVLMDLHPELRPGNLLAGLLRHCILLDFGSDSRDPSLARPIQRLPWGFWNHAAERSCPCGTAKLYPVVVESGRVAAFLTSAERAQKMGVPRTCADGRPHYSRSSGRIRTPPMNRGKDDFAQEIRAWIRRLKGDP